MPVVIKHKQINTIKPAIITPEIIPFSFLLIIVGLSIAVSVGF